VTKLESSDSRYNAALSTSQVHPCAPSSRVDTILAITRRQIVRIVQRRLIGPGLTTLSGMTIFEIRGPGAQKERIAALLAAKRQRPGVPFTLATEPVRMMEPPIMQEGCKPFCIREQCALYIDV